MGPMLWLLLAACFPQAPTAPPPTTPPAEAPATPPAAAPSGPVTALVPRPDQLPARTGAVPYADDLSYLEDELRWIEARVRRLALATKLRKATDPSARWIAKLAERRAAEGYLRAHIDARRAAGPPLALDRLCAVLGLGDFERLVLLLATAPCCSRTFEDIFGMLDKDGAPNTLTVEVVFNFAELPFAERVRRRAVFSPEAPLVREDLVVVDLRQRAVAPRDLLMADLELTGRAFSFLSGDDSMADELAAFSSVAPPLARLEDVVLPAADRDRIQAVVDNHDAYLGLRAAWGIDEVVRYGRGALLLFYGPPGTGKTMTAHGVADRMGRKLLNVDVPTFLAHEQAGRFLPGLFREARLQDAVLFFDECETLLRTRSTGNALLTVLLTELERFDGVAVLATNLPGQLDAAIARRILVRVRFQPPDATARAAIWRRHLPPTVPLDNNVDIDALAARYPLSGGDIKNAVLSAVAEALYDGSPERLQARHLDLAARTQLSRPTDAPLQQPRHTLADLIVPDAQRAALSAVADSVTSDHSAIIAISGPAGVGRTTATQALAAALARPLLPASPQTLAARLDEATRQRAVLHVEGLEHTPLDPELLRTLTEVQGLVVIECDSLSSLAPGLQQRLSLHIPLPRPDAAARLALWQRLLPGCPAQELSALPLTGGQIAQVARALDITGQPPTAEAVRAVVSSRFTGVGFRS